MLSHQLRIVNTFVYFCACCSSYEYVALSLFVFRFAFTFVFVFVFIFVFVLVFVFEFAFMGWICVNICICICIMQFVFAFVGEFTGYMLTGSLIIFPHEGACKPEIDLVEINTSVLSTTVLSTISQHCEWYHVAFCCLIQQFWILQHCKGFNVCFKRWNPHTFNKSSFHKLDILGFAEHPIKMGCSAKEWGISIIQPKILQSNQIQGSWQ